MTLLELPEDILRLVFDAVAPPNPSCAALASVYYNRVKYAFTRAPSLASGTPSMRSCVREYVDASLMVVCGEKAMLSVMHRYYLSTNKDALNTHWYDATPAFNYMFHTPSIEWVGEVRRACCAMTKRHTRCKHAITRQLPYSMPPTQPGLSKTTRVSLNAYGRDARPSIYRSSARRASRPTTSSSCACAPSRTILATVFELRVAFRESTPFGDIRGLNGWTNHPNALVTRRVHRLDVLASEIVPRHASA